MTTTSFSLQQSAFFGQKEVMENADQQENPA
jgi:hypothetical protein